MRELVRGQQVHRSGDAEVGTVQAVSDGLVTVAFAGRTVTVHADDLEPAPSSAAELLASGELQDSTAHYLKLLATCLGHAYRYDPLAGLSNARIEPEPHQVFVAHRVTNKLRPRMILADEVGLGKTIEAGLILKELRARQTVERVLVVTPASLTRQWQAELRSKFNEEFTIIDGQAAAYLGKGGDNPWAKVDNVICSLPFASMKKRAEQIADCDWDLVIFDEAHRVRRTRPSAGEGHTTQAYRLADELKETTTGLLLLTATPVQLHAFELYSLIELVEPGLYTSFEHFERERRLLRPLNDLTRVLQTWEALSPEEHDLARVEHRDLLEKIHYFDHPLDTAADRTAAMNALGSLHPLTEALVRNRKSQIGIVSDRRARRFPVGMTADERAIYEEVSGYITETYQAAVDQKNLAVGFVMVTYQKMLTSSSQALRTSLSRRAKRLREELTGVRKPKKKLSRENADVLLDAEEVSEALALTEESLLEKFELQLEIERLEDLALRLAQIRDSKADKLLDVIEGIFAEHPDEKVVIFTQFIETQTFIAAMLRGNDLKVSLFNGQMKPEQKEEQIDYFRRETQILISTEAGGEGRNLQFCHYLINYDLPWNPMKVEQRIGRLDRIGQKHPVIIYNLAYEDTVESRVLDVLEQRIRLFEESIGALDPILGEMEKDIERIVLGDAKTVEQELSRYAIDLEHKVASARVAEETLADFVLDRASLRRDQANELLGRRPLADHRELRAFTERSLAYLGGSVTEHPDGGQVISLSSKLAAQLGLRRSVVRGAFDPKIAQELGELDFFAFGHELIDKLLRRVVDLEFSATGARSSRSVPAGDWIEVVYAVLGGGVKPRGRLIRHLVNAGSEVVSEEVRTIDVTAQPIDVDVPEWAAEAVRASHEQFQVEFFKAREELQVEHEAIKDAEVQRVERVFDYRENRLLTDIARARDWLEARRDGAGERDLKVMPARRGALAKNEERLERVRAEREVELESVRGKQVLVEGGVVTAGIVRGTA